MTLDGGTLVVGLEADASKLSASIAKGTQAGVAKAAAPIHAAASKLTGLLTVGLATGAGAVLTKFFGDAVTAASDLSEAVNKTRVVFDDAAGQVLAFGRTSAEGFGISESAANEAAASFGQLLETSGLAESRAASMSVQLVKLAADLASFNNIDPSEALEKLRSGLAGEAEPLRQVGVLLSEARVKQEAYRAGIAKVGRELTEAQKVQARYRLILEDTAKAQGDFGRTAEGLANRQRILRASWEDMQAQLGQELLPVMVELADAVQKIGQIVLPIASAAFRELGKEVALVTESFGPIVDLLNQVAGSSSDAADKSSLWSTALGILNKVNPLRWINEYNAAVLRLIGLTDDAAAAVGRGGKGIERLGPPLEALSKATRRFGFTTDEAFEEFKKGVVESVQVSIGQFDKLSDAFGTTTKELQRQVELAVRIARTEHRDLRAIFADTSLTAEMRRAIAALPAEQRHAFAEGGKKVREQIAADAVTLERLNAKNFQQLTRGSRRLAEEGGTSAGEAFGDGLASGITATQGAVADAAARLARIAVESARHELGISSPSRVMYEIGRDVVRGFELGIGSKLSGISDQLRGLVADLRKSIGVAAADQALAFARDLDVLGRRFDKLRDKVRGFRDAIRSGFEQFDLVGGLISQLDDFKAAQERFLADQKAFEAGTLDTAPTAPLPPDLHAFLTAQADQAQQLADVLQQLSAAGLNTETLGQLAAAGPNGVALGQALLDDPSLIAALNQAQAQIAQALGQTTQQLVSDQFGKDLEVLERQFERLGERLVRFLARLGDEAMPAVGRIVKRLNEILGDLGLPTVHRSSGWATSPCRGFGGLYPRADFSRGGPARDPARRGGRRGPGQRRGGDARRRPSLDQGPNLGR